MTEANSREHVSIEVTNLNRLLSSSISGKLCQESPSLSESCIFEVPRTLRRQKEIFFEPNIVSIGPFHRGNTRFSKMDKIKSWYLHCLLNRFPLAPEETLEHFVDETRKHADRARSYYAEQVLLSEDDFVEMMVIDGCFLIELFRREAWLVPRDKDDPIFNSSWMLENLYHDLILLENQIPWFVLDHLFSLTISVHEQETNFLVDLVLGFFETMMLMTVPAQYPSRGREIKHILDLLHSCLLSLNGEIPSENTNWELFPPITDLLRAGVRFRKGNAEDILNIKFQNGVFEIPPIKIRGNSESLFRNLIAYEQCDRICADKFTSYAVFLDCLINTSKDADLLCEEKIVIHALSTEDVSHLFNGLYNDTLVYDFYYGGISKKVNDYYQSQWTRWRTTLKHDYFRNPWSISSFIAAILILGLTFTQTLFSVLSYE